MNIKRGSAPAASNDDHLIPLINVVFLMLIFFMLAGQIRASDGLPFFPQPWTPADRRCPRRSRF